MNYDVPDSAEVYVHRIGRTGRAGREGVAITLAEPREHRLLRNIEDLTSQQIRIEAVPTVVDLRARRLDLLRNSLREALVEDGFDSYRVVVESLSEEFDVMQIAMAALQLAHAAEGGLAEREDAQDIPSLSFPQGRGGPSRGADRSSGRGRPERFERGDRNDRGPRRDRFENDRTTAPRAPRGEYPDRAPRDRAPERSGPRAGFDDVLRPRDPRDRDPRGERDARPRRPGGGDVTRVFVGLGKQAGVRPGDLVGAIANEAGVDARDIGAIDIGDRFSLVEVPGVAAERVVRALRETTIRGRKVEARRDRGDE